MPDTMNPLVVHSCRIWAVKRLTSFIQARGDHEENLALEIVLDEIQQLQALAKPGSDSVCSFLEQLLANEDDSKGTVLSDEEMGAVLEQFDEIFEDERRAAANIVEIDLADLAEGPETQAVHGLAIVDGQQGGREASSPETDASAEERDEPAPGPENSPASPQQTGGDALHADKQMLIDVLAKRPQSRLTLRAIHKDLPGHVKMFGWRLMQPLEALCEDGTVQLTKVSGVPCYQITLEGIKAASVIETAVAPPKPRRCEKCGKDFPAQGFRLHVRWCGHKKKEKAAGTVSTVDSETVPAAPDLNLQEGGTVLAREAETVPADQAKGDSAYVYAKDGDYTIEDVNRPKRDFLRKLTPCETIPADHIADAGNMAFDAPAAKAEEPPIVIAPKEIPASAPVRRDPKELTLEIRRLLRDHVPFGISEPMANRVLHAIITGDLEVYRGAHEYRAALGQEGQQLYDRLALEQMAEIPRTHRDGKPMKAKDGSQNASA